MHPRVAHPTSSAPRRTARLRRGLALLATGFVVALSAHCNFIVDPGDFHVVDEPAPTCGGFAFAEASCESCVEAEKGCCQEASACRESGGCATYFDCVAACPAADLSCRATCEAKRSSTDEAATALAGCWKQTCTNECATCGAFAFGEAACGTCLEGACCDALAACRESAGCAVYTDCIGSCAATDSACRFACEAKRPEGDVALPIVLACRDRECRDACTACGALYEWKAPTCGACIQARCCAEASACLDDPGCTTGARCESEGTYGLASRVCAPLLNPGSSLYQDARSCAATQCKAECIIGQDWSCVGTVTYPAAKSAELLFDIYLGDPATGDGVPGVEVKACAAFDVDCVEPAAVVTSDATGYARLVLPAPWQSFFRLTGGGLYPAMLFISDKLTGPHFFGYGRNFTSVAVANAVAASAGITPDPARGHVIVTIEDCFAARAAGISISASPGDGGSVLYFDEGALIVATATTSNGEAAIFNVKPGYVTVTATLEATKQEIGKYTVLVNAAEITTLYATPSP